jgi:hypothetical protein
LAGAATVPGFDYCGMASRGHCKTVVKNVWGGNLHGRYSCQECVGVGICMGGIVRFGAGGGEREVSEMQRLGTATTCETRQMVSQGPSQFFAYNPLVLGRAVA